MAEDFQIREDAREANLAELTQSFLEATPQELGHALIDIARRARREFNGQHADLPDLSSPHSDANEAVVVWDYMVEIADRLIGSSGASMMKVAGETATPTLSNFTAIEIRTGLGEALAEMNFKTMALKLRHLNPVTIDPGAINMADIVGRRFDQGNILEIATARMCTLDDRTPRTSAGVDVMSRQIARAMAITDLGDASTDLFGVTTYTPELGAAVQSVIAAGRSRRETNGHIKDITRRMAPPRKVPDPQHANAPEAPSLSIL